MNILFCGNCGVQDGLAMSLISIAEHTDRKLNVILLTMDLTEKDARYVPIDTKYVKNLENYLKTFNNETKITLVDVTKLFYENFSNCVNMDNSYLPYAFIRLLADKVPEVTDKILYLDTDVMINKDISELYDIDLADYEYAACRDLFGKIFFMNVNYINSGVLLLNMKKIRETGLFEKCIHMVNTKKMRFPDQSALNKYCKNKMFLNDKYNSQYKCRKKDVIRHFCRTLRWLPIIHPINVKQHNIEKMHKVLKCHHYDKEYEKMLELKNSYKND